MEDSFSASLTIGASGTLRPGLPVSDQGWRVPTGANEGCRARVQMDMDGAVLPLVAHTIVETMPDMWDLPTG